MSSISHHIRMITAKGPRYAVCAGPLPAPLSVLIGVNGCGKTTLLKAIACAHRAARPNSIAGRPMSAEDAVWSAFSKLGKHIQTVEVEFSDKAIFNVSIEEAPGDDGRKPSKRIVASLRAVAGDELWNAVYQKPGDEEPLRDEGSLESETPQDDTDAPNNEAVLRYFRSIAEFIPTSRLDVTVPPREETVRKYEGVVYHKRVGSSTDRVRSFLEAVSGEPQQPRRIPRVHVLAAQLGLEADRIAKLHADEALRRDSKTVASALRAETATADPDQLTSQVYALEERLQAILAAIGLTDVPRFVDISLSRALADRPQQVAVYFQHSLASLQRLIDQVRPLSTFIEQSNSVLRGCRFRIAARADLKAQKLSAPPDQQRLLVVQFGSDETIHLPTELSSGQQHMLVLLSRIWLGDLTQRPDARTGNRLLLIDEPEISLHLAWHSEIAQQLRRFADETKSQVIVATHSNFISGSLPPSVIFEM